MRRRKGGRHRREEEEGEQGGKFKKEPWGGGFGSDKCYESIEPAFSGFGDMESSVYRRVLPVQKKLNTWTDRVKVMEEEDVRGKRLHSELRSRVRNLEE